ncbi:hypothetical protein FKP32DRAFT_513297 [Trametes sanguinea]|nr:hypothetical protein FKP32DRAFT_513297 [Trametes sanguinea]
MTGLRAVGHPSDCGSQSLPGGHPGTNAGPLQGMTLSRASTKAHCLITAAAGHLNEPWSGRGGSTCPCYLSFRNIRKTTRCGFGSAGRAPWAMSTHNPLRTHQALPGHELGSLGIACFAGRSKCCWGQSCVCVLTA